MPATTCFRALSLLIALGLGACATAADPVPTTHALLESMRAAPPATEQSCAAANMALVCSGSAISRVRPTDFSGGTCTCADRTEAKLGAWH
ncbi:MAG TPA: hypothetical protein VFS52_20510 [Steroidobacteraceae bacterium]|nr:hypothetical protein [Steroidobacteraceae bacterium]